MCTSFFFLNKRGYTLHILFKEICTLNEKKKKKENKEI